MNPLGALPAADSKQFSLSTLDYLKILRLLMVQILSLFLSTGVPALLGYHYVLNGVDYTGGVVIVVSTTAEMLRRFLAREPKD